MRIILMALFFLSLAACDQNREFKGEEETGIDTTVINANLDYPSQEVELVPATREITEDWLAYLTAQSEIENFRNYTVKEVSANATPIAEIMLSLRDTAPKQLNSNAVQTRLSVLYTKAKILEFLSGQREPDYVAIKSVAEEIPLEFNNFKIQINELFLETLEDLEERLDAFDVEDTTSRPLLRTLPRMGRQN